MLLRSSDRIIAFAIMYQCYPSEKPSVNPFISDMMNVSSFHRESTMLYAQRLEEMKILFASSVDFFGLLYLGEHVLRL